jgi:hypothetical protein
MAKLYRCFRPICTSLSFAPCRMKSLSNFCSPSFLPFSSSLCASLLCICLQILFGRPLFLLSNTFMCPNFASFVFPFCRFRYVPLRQRLTVAFNHSVLCPFFSADFSVPSHPPFLPSLFRRLLPALSPSLSVLCPLSSADFSVPSHPLFSPSSLLFSIRCSAHPFGTTFGPLFLWCTVPFDHPVPCPFHSVKALALYFSSFYCFLCFFLVHVTKPLFGRTSAPFLLQWVVPFNHYVLCVFPSVSSSVPSLPPFHFSFTPLSSFPIGPFVFRVFASLLFTVASVVQCRCSAPLNLYSSRLFPSSSFTKIFASFPTALPPPPFEDTLCCCSCH